jgi:hypothetical protein
MVKKVIIFSFIFALLSSITAPDFANAMGSSEMSVETALIISAVTIGIVVGVLYFTEWRDVEKTEKKTALIKETVQKNISQSGGLIVFRW